MKRTRYRVFREHPGEWVVKNAQTDAYMVSSWTTQEQAFAHAERLASITPGFSLMA